ncbi:MAG: domain containing protein [Myxococcaceae bacterium]|nr:domain containing protein [Myxococcaceae bacterium]
MRVATLWIHPVKSCRAVALERADLEETGFRLDRRWMIVDPDGAMVTQRTHPALATVAVAVADDHVSLRVDGHGPLTLALDPGAAAPLVRATVWDDLVEAPRASPDAAAWLRSALGLEGDLVCMPSPSGRAVDPRYARASDRVGFADGFPLLLATQASLDDLNARLADPVPMQRFRPNVVVDGAAPFDEDRWSVLRLGMVRCRAVKPCARCVIVNTDPWTGARGVEPLRTLSRFRTRESKVFFGQNLVLAGGSIGQSIAVGDEVVVETRLAPDEVLAFEAEVGAVE